MKIKRSFFAFALIFCICSFAPKTSSAFKSNVDMWVKDTGGTSHHIHGWLQWGLGGVSHCDLWFDQIHIVAIRVPINHGEYPNEGLQLTPYESTGGKNPSAEFIESVSPFPIVVNNTPLELLEL